MRRGLLALAILPFVLLAGCNADPYSGLPEDEQQAPASVQAVSVDDEGPRDWIRIQMQEQEEGQQAYPFEEVSVRVVAPRALERSGFACLTPEGTWHDGCQDPFEQGDRLEVGDELWIPCASAGNHRVTVELGLNMIDGPVECEAGAGEEGPEQADVSRSTHDADEDGNVDWLELVLESGDNAPYGPDEVRVTIEADGETREDLLCQSAEGSWDGGCEAPFEGEARWSAGGSLFVPCSEDEDPRVTVDIRGVTQLEGGFFCEETA